jgi:uncharacterized protein YbjT (DUF2867 family)
MQNVAEEEIYLILGASGRQGSATVDALLSKNCLSETVYGASRNPESLKKRRGDSINVVKADMNDPESIIAAIDKSKATRVWFVTDWYSIKRPSRAKEAQLGYNVIDAIKKRSNQVKHVVYNSGADADRAPKIIGEFWSKVDIENYMEQELASVQVSWSVLRPVAFLENLDDAKNGNPLTKGSVKMLTKKDCSVKYISAADIGKGSATLLMNPEEYAGKKVDAATCEYTGSELADILTKVSGVECKYSVSVPRFVLRFFVRNLYHMVTFFEKEAYDDTNIEDYRKMVPDYQDAEAWFISKGQWANGDKLVA